jgi:NAD(P)-dependent dehydrogenase (short-subunit alcohol dehydrogenase family)
MQELGGRVAIITGAGSGIGRASALALAGEGVDVVVADLDGDRARAVAAEVVASGRRGLGLACDVTAEGVFEMLRDAALDELGRVDIVMNNVGVLAAGLPEAIPIEAWRRIIETNLLSAVRSNLVFVPLLLAQGHGHLVFTASTNALYSYSYDRLPYTATKAAVIAMAEALSLYLRPQGIGVTCLCPGPTITNIVEQVSVYGPGRPVQSPDLPLQQASDVARVLVEAIRADTFLALAHPEVHDTLVRRATDPEAFLAGQIAAVGAVTTPSNVTDAAAETPR